ncbi:MAG: Asp-tRNA(Asn)/Glu-tRNA(Gln) amidotransferase subunit GatC, partial [Chitinispirillaceae bacterium]|nr:Asp-tRNA(Asn)/Glu-tRNA(Gln) amidotransferase subunit GatC [Chitinispirillaceae bacterium]
VMIDREQVLKTAQLARLKLSEKETADFTGQLGAIIDFVKQLDGVDTAGVEPTCFVEPPHDPTRADAERPSLTQEETLRNGPKVKQGFFAVPKVIEQ